MQSVRVHDRNHVNLPSAPGRGATSLWASLAWLKLDPDGRVLDLSDPAIRLLGPLSAGMRGRYFAEACPVALHPGSTSGDIHGLAFDLTEPPWFRVERVETPDGSFALLTDATDIVRLRRECVALTRLASAGRLISGIVHEINNPLSSIVGYAQLLQTHDLDRDTRSSVDKIHSEAQRTSRIVRNLLNFSRRRKTTRGGVQLARALHEALELKAHDLRIHNISVHQDVPEGTCEVSADHDQVVQVLVNLVTNSEQAMYSADRGGRLTFLGRETPTGVTLHVADTGPGIPTEHRERVFEPFFTTKKEGEGTGLGLDLCREILSQHDATIVLVDSADRGATFQLVFTRYDGMGPKALARPIGKSTRVRGRRIVVVEDDANCRSLLTETFQAAGNTVHAFDRGETALQFLGRHVVDVILSDLRRPGLCGLEFLGRIRELDDQLASRVLFLSGDMVNEETNLALMRSGNQLLAKPIDVADLHAAVARIVNRPSGRQRELFERDA